MLEEQDPQNPPYYNLMKLLFKNSITKKTENEFIVLFPVLLNYLVLNNRNYY